MFKTALALAFLVLPFAIPGAAADEPERVATAPGSASVGEVTLPSKKNGLRDLDYALGKDAAGEIRADVTRCLREIRAFAEVPDSGGTRELVLRYEKVTQVLDDFRDLAAQGRRSTVSLRAEVSYEWREAGRVLHAGTTTAASVTALPPGSIRGTLREGWRSLHDQLGRLVFAEAVEAGAFGSLSKDSPWIAPAPR